MKRCGELVLSCAALEIVPALGYGVCRQRPWESAVSGRDSHRVPKDWYGTSGLVGNLVCESDVTGLRLGLRCASATC